MLSATLSVSRHLPTSHIQSNRLLSAVSFIPHITFGRFHWFHLMLCRMLLPDRIKLNTGLFEMIVGIMGLHLQMQPHVISFYGVTSRIRFMFLLFPQVSRNLRYESEPPLTCCKQFGTNSIIVLMFVESQRVHI